MCVCGWCVCVCVWCIGVYVCVWLVCVYVCECVTVFRLPSSKKEEGSLGSSFPARLGRLHSCSVDYFSVISS